ncbi:MAG: succinate dehydrogenase/fumarate reductase iron-sulfur subunit, partial [Acidobacteria bacterium]|nr:succinate dehydrogenase/fumarate reductase iron-sulfur subunit [Acidobacteriota bacterium]
MTATEFVVHRFEPGRDPAPYYEAFEVPADPDYTVLDGLFYIQAELDPTLSFRCACRNWMCGTCGVRVNGRPRLGCKTPLRELPPKIFVEPMLNLPVVKDLVTDMAPFFARWQKVMNAFVPAPDAGGEPLRVRPEERGQVDTMLECIACGLCLSACTMVAVDPGFLGPAALTRAYCLVEDRRDAARNERLRILASEDGVFRCHGHGDCQE